MWNPTASRTCFVVHYLLSGVWLFGTPWLQYLNWSQLKSYFTPTPSPCCWRWWGWGGRTFTCILGMGHWSVLLCETSCWKGIWRKKLLFIFAIFIFVTFYASAKSNTVMFSFEYVLLAREPQNLISTEDTYALAEIYEMWVQRWQDQVKLCSWRAQLWWPWATCRRFHTFPCFHVDFF